MLYLSQRFLDYVIPFNKFISFLGKKREMSKKENWENTVYLKTTHIFFLNIFFLVQCFTREVGLPWGFCDNSSILGCPNLMGAATGIQRVEGRNATKRVAMHKGTPVTRKLPGPNFNGTTLGKSVAQGGKKKRKDKKYSRQSVSNGTSTFFGNNTSNIQF